MQQVQRRGVSVIAGKIDENLQRKAKCEIFLFGNFLGPPQKHVPFAVSIEIRLLGGT